MARRNVGERWCDLRRWDGKQLLRVMLCVFSLRLYPAVRVVVRLHASLAVSFTRSKSWKYHIGHCYTVGEALAVVTASCRSSSTSKAVPDRANAVLQIAPDGAHLVGGPLAGHFKWRLG